MGPWPHGFPEFVALFAQLKVGADELTERLRVGSLLLSIPSLSDDILAEPGLSQDHGCFLADGRQRASNPRTKRLTSLLLADSVLSEVLPLANFRTPNPGNSSSKAWMSLAPSGTVRSRMSLSVSLAMAVPYSGTEIHVPSCCDLLRSARIISDRCTEFYRYIRGLCRLLPSHATFC